MERALVLVEDTPHHRQLLETAGELAAGVGAELLLVATMTAEEAEENLQQMEQIARIERTSYNSGDVLEAAGALARDVGREVFKDTDVDFEALGIYVEDDDRASAVLRTADQHDCDHIFITGRRRSPTGKAIFGDTAQRVILNYDGPVTVLTG